MSTERKTIGWTCKREVDEKVECKQLEEETQSMSPERKTINRLDMQEGSERTIGRNTFKQERTIAEEGMKANGNTIA